MMIKPAQIIFKEDAAPYSIDFNDIYFSVDNGIDESKYVYIDGNNLIERFQKLNENELFTIIENGFGTGLNFLLTLETFIQHANKTAQLLYVATELYPLKIDDITHILSLFFTKNEYKISLINQYPPLVPGVHYLLFDNERVHLQLLFGDCVQLLNQFIYTHDVLAERKMNPLCADAWYLDGFTPTKNEAMWSSEWFKLMCYLSKENTTVATFSASRLVKDELKKVGFNIEKIKGYGNKRHMIKGYFEIDKAIQSAFKVPPREKKTPWYIHVKQSEIIKRVAVIGAGLSGAMIAHFLSKKINHIDIYEKNTESALEASGNKAGLLFPMFSPHYSPINQLMLESYLFSNHFYDKINFGIKTGMIYAPFQARALKQLDMLEAWFESYPYFGKRCDDGGKQLNSFYIYETRIMDIPMLVSTLLKSPHMSLKYDSSIDMSESVLETRIISDIQYDAIVITSGIHFHSNTIPIKPIPGQLTYIHNKTIVENHPIPVCGEGHYIPLSEELSVIGATYHVKSNDVSCQISHHDNILNIEKGSRLLKENISIDNYHHAWRGIRATFPDYMPMVGALPNQIKFKKLYASLSKNAKAFVPEALPTWDGVYIMTGFGSKGLTTTPYAAKWLSDVILGLPSLWSKDLIKASSPARFLYKELFL